MAKCMNMKTTLILTILLVLSVAEKAYPQNPYLVQKSECEHYFALEHENLRAKKFDLAYEDWMKVYTTCPDIQRQLYTDGAYILDALYERAKADGNETEQIRIAKQIMDMYDTRIKCFGRDRRYPAAYILSCKAVDYKHYFEGTKEYKPYMAYSWLHAAMKYKQPAPSLPALELLFDMSYDNYRAHSTSEQIKAYFIEDYDNVISGLNTIIQDSTSSYRQKALPKKIEISEKFAQSGVTR